MKGFIFLKKGYIYLFILKVERILIILFAILAVIAAALENYSLAKEIIYYVNGILMLLVAVTQLKKSKFNFGVTILASICIFSLAITLHN